MNIHVIVYRRWGQIIKVLENHAEKFTFEGEKYSSLKSAFSHLLFSLHCFPLVLFSPQPLAPLPHPSVIYWQLLSTGLLPRFDDELAVIASTTVSNTEFPASETQRRHLFTCFKFRCHLWFTGKLLNLLKKTLTSQGHLAYSTCFLTELWHISSSIIKNIFPFAHCGGGQDIRGLDGNGKNYNIKSVSLYSLPTVLIPLTTGQHFLQVRNCSLSVCLSVSLLPSPLHPGPSLHQESFLWKSVPGSQTKAFTD